MAKSQHQAASEQTRKDLLRDGSRALDEIDKLSKAVRRCIEQSEGFPIYLGDLGDAVRYLSATAAAFNALRGVELQAKRARRDLQS